ncbi:unnamed protein product [Ambrosiozyma monospora]|uniref:Unnamed protein product n=1 Tax=Ambrosiozyma monospora TaxID=43982 RepID=A0ACB5ST85_AMBMO|nr:unnamed protein product [Ambrosiozyma monospora]
MPYSFNLDLVITSLDRIMKQMLHVLFTINSSENPTSSDENSTSFGDDRDKNSSTMFDLGRGIILSEFSYEYPETTDDVLFQSDPHHLFNLKQEDSLVLLNSLNIVHYCAYQDETQQLSDSEKTQKSVFMWILELNTNLKLALLHEFPVFNSDSLE